MKPLIIVFFLIAFADCGDTCEKYKNEIYTGKTLEQTFDSTRLNGFKQYLIMLHEHEINTLNYESYRLIAHVSHVPSYIIQIENKNSIYHVTHKKLIHDSDSTFVVVKQIEKQLSADEWAKFIAFIYQKNYWTLPINTNKYDVLDGGQYTIEGRRPNAEICGKRSYHLITSDHPQGEFKDLFDNFFEIIEPQK